MRDDAGMLCKCDKVGCSRAYKKPVNLTIHHKEDNPSFGLKRPFICEKCNSKFVRKEQLSLHVQTLHATKRV